MAIESDYGVCIEYNVYGVGFLLEQVMAIELALADTGPVFTQHVNNIRLPGGYSPEFRIRISDDLAKLHPNAIGCYQITTEEHILHLYPSKHYIPSASDILHELGHAAAYLSNGQVNVFADFAAINGAYTGVFERDRYVSAYAATNASEDFAETFCFMVKNAGEASEPVGEDTVLYQKYWYLHDFLVDYLGMDSRVTQKTADFMQITTQYHDKK